MINVFDLLHPRLRQVIREFGYEEPTPVQREAIPLVLQGNNVLITAPTGTGKTEAAMFPALSRMLELLEKKPEPGIYILYITPMRALNRDIYVRLRQICSKLGVAMAVRHGDTPESERRRQAEAPPQVLVTTPETLQFLLVAPKMRRWLRTVRFVIVDEIHELASDKRGIQLALSLERLVEIAGEFQRIGLSATVGDPELIAKFLAGTNRSFRVVQISGLKSMRLSVVRPVPTVSDIEKASKLGVMPEVYARLRKLSELISKFRTVLIFVNTRDTAELLGSRLAKIVEYEIGVYHGSLSREQRESLEQKLREGKVKAVVTTSSLELGIDIGTIDAVIQYMSPRQVTRLVQRVGRSRHKLGEESLGIIITSDLDDTLESLVIAKFAIEGKLERSLEYHEEALDVLAHQIVGMSLEAKLDDKPLTISRLLDIVRRAHPYRNMDMYKLMKVLKFLEERGYIMIDEDRVVPRRGSYMYYVENASMIPDEVRYEAIDISSRRTVGELDEEFVTTIELGSRIILGGRVWTVVNIDHSGKRVYLEPCQEVVGAVPAWLGEEIPVLPEVAQEVIDLRADLVEHGVKPVLTKLVTERLHVEDDTVKFLEEEVSKIRNEDIVLPRRDQIVIECTERIVVIHVGLGSKGNEALGLYVTRYLSKNFLLNVAYRSDPYRVILLFSKQANPELVIRALKESDSVVYNTTIDAIRNSKLFKYRFIHVARRFGVVPKDRVGDVNVQKLIEAYRDTIVEDETIREILVDKVDIDTLLSFIRSVREGKIKIVVSRRENLSYIALSEESLYNRFEFTISTIPKQLIVELVKRRLEERELTLVCIRCGWHFTGKVKDVPEDLHCPQCGFRTIAVLKYRHEDLKTVLKVIEKVRKKEPLSPEEQKLFNELKQRANVILQYGKRGLYALAAHGVGASTALRKVLSKASTEEELFLAILEAEKEYIRTRQFWD